MQQLTAYPEIAEHLAGQVREAVLDHAAFEQKIRACELSRCRATCCHDGVHLSAEEAEGIAALVGKSDSIREHLAGADCFVSSGGNMKTATRAAQEGELAVDFPPHFPKTRCVFLDRQGRCAIQMHSTANGFQPWFHKPLTCWIHPLVILPVNAERSRPVLTLVNPENDPQRSKGYPGFASCTHCGRPDPEGEPAVDVLRAELAMLSALSGRGILEELNAEGF